MAWRRARLALYGATACVYAIAITSPFQFDDHGISRALGGLRPLLKLSYALCGVLGSSPAAFHLFNLLLHVANVGLVLRVGLLVRSRLAAFTAATLFALHPIHTEAVTYISGRSSLMSTSFMLLALLAHAHGVRGGRRLLVWGAAPLAFILAVLTKETALVLPLGLLLWDALIEGTPWRELAKRQAPWWIAGVVLFVFMVGNERYFALIYRVVGQRAFRDALAYQLAGIWYLTTRLVLAQRPCIDPGLWTPPSTAAIAGGVAVVLTMVAIAVSQRRARPVLSFGLTWFLVHAFVPYVLVSRVDVINERHAYIADAGLFMAAGALWAELRLPRVALGALVTTAMCVLTLVRNREYRSELALWQSTVREAPRNPRALNNLGVAYEQANDPDAAHSAYLHAALAEPRYTPARQNLERLSAQMRAPAHRP